MFPALHRAMEALQLWLGKHILNQPLLLKLIYADATPLDELILGIAQKDEERVRHALSRSQVANRRDEDGDHPLLLAMASTPGIVRLLLEAGANPSAREKGSGHTPLHLTADATIAELLLAHGADVNAEDAGGNTPLHFANSDLIPSLLAHGADVNARNHAGSTPLMLKAHPFSSDPEALLMLLEAGADPNARDEDNGQSALHRIDDAACAELLLIHGADVNAQDKNGNTPLHLASGDIIPLLLAHGADVNARNHAGATPLHFAQNTAEAALLLAHGADVNAQDEDGDTPLHLADDDLIALLLAHGADAQRLNTAGKKAHHH